MSITVYYLNEDGDRMLGYRSAEFIKATIPVSSYKAVASVNTDDIEVAFEKTNTIDRHWHNNPEVTVLSHAVSNR
jgi:UDP-galactopyranose mutase